MSLAVPTTQTIADNIVAQLQASIGQTIPLLPKSFSRVLAKAIAGVFILLYKYAGFAWLQMFVAFASSKETTVNGRTLIPLIEHGRLIGVGDPKDANRAELFVTVIVTNQVGTLGAGSQGVCADTGVLYEIVADVALNAATVPATFRALSDQSGGDGTGSIGNLNPGATISFVQPLANVARDTTVTGANITAADAEDVDTAYRSRVFQRFQAKPQGGAYADYREWALTVDGIVAAYPYASATPGEVDVYVEADVASSGSPDGIPTDAQVTAVDAAIELDDSGSATRRPVNAAVNVLKITRTALDVTVTGIGQLSADDLVKTQAAISVGLDEFMRSREPFIVGLSVLPRADRIAIAALGGVVDGIVGAAGGTVVSVTFTGGGTALTLAAGQKAKLGTLTFA